MLACPLWPYCRIETVTITIFVDGVTNLWFVRLVMSKSEFQIIWPSVAGNCGLFITTCPGHKPGHFISAGETSQKTCIRKSRCRFSGLQSRASALPGPSNRVKQNIRPPLWAVGNSGRQVNRPGSYSKHIRRANSPVATPLPKLGQSNARPLN